MVAGCYSPRGQNSRCSFQHYFPWTNGMWCSKCCMMAESGISTTAPISCRLVWKNLELAPYTEYTLLHGKVSFAYFYFIIYVLIEYFISGTPNDILSLPVGLCRLLRLQLFTRGKPGCKLIYIVCVNPGIHIVCVNPSIHIVCVNPGIYTLPFPGVHYRQGCPGGTGFCVS